MAVAQRFPSAPMQISPGIAHSPSRLCLSDLRHGVPYKFRALTIIAALPRRTASYPLPVRQASALPSASSRFPVTQNTLAVQLTLPLVGRVEDFHLQVSAPCRAHNGKWRDGNRAIGKEHCGLKRVFSTASTFKVTGAARLYRPAPVERMMDSALGDTQDQAPATRFDVLSKGGDRGRMLACSERSLQPGYRRCLRTHEFRNLSLCQTGLLARLEQCIQQNALVSLDTFNFSAYARTTHELLHQLIMCLHV